MSSMSDFPDVVANLETAFAKSGPDILRTVYTYAAGFVIIAMLIAVLIPSRWL